jgi:membrane fusion protein, type I secretion system
MPDSTVEANLPPAGAPPGSRRAFLAFIKDRATGVIAGFRNISALLFGGKGNAAPDRLRAMLAGTVLVGIGIGGFMFCSLFLWAGLAPLASAAVAPGKVSPDSSRKTIQHLEGGIIREIRVKEGDRIEQGAPLFSLEPLAAQAAYSSKRLQWMRLQVTRARLEAHRIDKEKFEPTQFPNFPTDVEFEKFSADQVQLFYARRKNFIEREQILRQQVLQLKQQAEAKTRENESLDKQREFIQEELADKKELVEKNLVRKPEYLALMRLNSDLLGRREANTAELARIAERIGEVELQVVMNKTQLDQELSDQLAKVNSDIAQLEETLSASQDVLRRTEIAAPVSGRVINMRFKTVGGVVRPGEAMVDIVPTNDNLIIDAKLSPNDIDVVHPGLLAEVYLTPYVSRNTPRLKGVVIHVSADTTTEQGQPTQSEAAQFYEIRVQVDSKEIQHVPNLRLYPGMPAEVYIMTGARTFGEYLIDPLKNSFRRAFIED